jgi:DNA uptake protein ComE-like DNA-binding protein
MPKFTTPFWDDKGALYRAGTEVPASAVKAAGESKASTGGTGGGGTDADKDALPKDFPAYDSLTGGGYKTKTAVRTASDEELDGLPNIGPATVREIRDALGGV